ncbi:MAG: molybdate ABC transporter substrate-binding protein [Gemmatimonadetes bacterium]|nr:molybdate ABC transporter substrate-binding protein [Gemmatimonadota bacterium]MXX71543.1 molybdate ABC transporter substrate-binding protein [Gemmatimonadota bacterium]MYC91896.1 molybdate ABC transporter substrate-binding protein [Gemmatimonadota bacterium]MYG35348.1 molybdate ABC transporter substrate-binding protein [Gemmatimonadota bacterium]MYJ18533.1 molybdate ABC transporter substrate-binding protein [Gemmatimonadota bacterium]
MRTRGAAALNAAVLSATLLLPGCGSADPERQPLRVFAASSLTDAFSDMAGAFEASHPETEVVLVFAGSQVLRLQIEQGAPADVFASADPRHMESLVGEGLVTGQRVLAENELVVIVPRGNPSRIEAFADLVRAERLVIGTPYVPVGAYTREALRRAGADGGLPGFEAEVLGRVVSEESNVRLVRAKVELGEADAAIVYRTDAAPGRVRTVRVPSRANVRAQYLIGVVAGAENVAGAERWAGFVASPEGRRILSRHGFLTDVTTAQ